MSDKVESPKPALGQALTGQLEMRFFIPRIEAGEAMIPAKINDQEGLELASLRMSLNDLSFSLECFQEVEKLGVPNVASLNSKVFAFSAIVAYARAFDMGARDLKLQPALFEGLGVPFTLPLHEYLRAVRDKHIAHSVNEFELCRPVAIMVGMPGATVRPGGIGFAQTQSIGIRREQALEAVAHLTAIVDALRKLIADRQEKIFNSFKEQFEKDGKWRLAPIASLPDGAKVAVRRPR